MVEPTPLRVAAAPSPSLEAPREPTPEQNQSIMSMLEVVYDRAAKRYMGCESDVSVAEALKDEGILPGWVTRIRELLFGLNGGNEEDGQLDREIKALLLEIDKRQAEILDGMKEFQTAWEARFGEAIRSVDAARDKARDMQARFDRWKAAQGPKGRAI